MSIFRVFVDDNLFYHPRLSKLAITQAKVHEDAENIDSLTLSAPYNHPYLNDIVPLVSTIVCKKDDTIVFEGRAIDDGSDFYNTHTWTCESCMAYAMYHCTMCDACANDCVTGWRPTDFTREARMHAVVNDIAPKAIMTEIDNKAIQRKT